ncbi:hypothetical protein M409DRAFT_48787 [Zasmidium cellare ATCC 36951]|uniref:BTB domain-containing protein n=1 Tax=Zasmidium cellare ATCC 36951 TaxID=1080233 RepID=A0A6A6D6M3_ZASCE|nr:uncharacterized protein M409DRAFT_48787 [Zasmidium cellare ATCC 36951]KAF2173872.1 hypothetical protein M409DRAFT_48787 [Zasmidium cellare ATCC 36951]
MGTASIASRQTQQDQSSQTSVVHQMFQGLTVSQTFLPSRTSDFEIRIANNPARFAMHSDVLSRVSRYFATVCDKNKFEEGKTGSVVLEHDEDVVERLLRFIYQLPVDWLTFGDEDFSSPSTSQQNYLDLMRLREAADYYELQDMHVETTRAIRAVFDGVKQPDTLTWMGRDAHESGHLAGHAVLWEIQNETRKRILEIVRDREAWSNVYANEEYVKKVTCGLAGCNSCRRAVPH